MASIPPDNPAGPFQAVAGYNGELRNALAEQIRDAPPKLRRALAGLSDLQLDTRYRNWTIRQIAHHLADSHLNSMIRFKWTLAEEHPTIKAYEEADWVELSDCKFGAVAPPLAMLEGLHSKWVQVLDSMTPEQFDRAFLHPQTGESVTLWTALNYYTWHARHHTAQILWVRDQNGW